MYGRDHSLISKEAIMKKRQQGVPLPTKKGGYSKTIEGLIEAGITLPAFTSRELNKDLRDNTIGPFSLRDAMHSRELNLGPRNASRYGSIVVEDELRHLKLIDDVVERITDYEKLAKEQDLPEDERKTDADEIEAAVKSYHPYVSVKFAIWYSDYDTKDEIANRFSDARLAPGLVYAFQAGAFSKLSCLTENQRKCLERDYQRGIRYIHKVIGTYDYVIKYHQEHPVVSVGDVGKFRRSD